MCKWYELMANITKWKGVFRNFVDTDVVAVVVVVGASDAVGSAGQAACAVASCLHLHSSKKEKVFWNCD